MPEKTEVLIVEDKEDTAAALLSLLVFHGYSAATVATKEKAREWFSTHLDFNLKAIIIDVTLPDGNGIELINQVNELYPQCKVIVTSGFAQQEWGEDLPYVDPDNVLMKPIDFPLLYQKLPAPN